MAKSARKSYRYYPNNSTYEERENILNRVFTTKEKNKIWVGDITYIPTNHGFQYIHSTLNWISPVEFESINSYPP